MAENHQVHVNGGTSSVNYNGEGAGESSSSMEDLMRKLGNSLTKQQILLQGSDDVNTYPVYGQEVVIVSSTASGSPENSASSNKVKINPAVKHDWEQKYHLGNIVSSHKNGVYIAYVLKVRTGGVVRIINRKTAQRALLKGFDGLVMDIAFAHIDEVLLACVDEVGSLHVYKVEEGPETITTLMVKIMRPDGCPKAIQHRVIWCPFIPDPDSEDDDEEASDDFGKVLVVTHDSMAEMYNLETITARKPPNLTLVSMDIPDGFQVIPGHEKLITDAVFSPDGSALATACLDGEVRVFSMAINEDATPPKCLHKWKPHDGRPISMLVFLDNYKDPQQQFWKFAVTGANYNQEIKIWSCVSWTCLQTIKFLPPPDLSGTPVLEPCLKAGVDSTAEFLVLSDVNRKVMFVMTIQQDWEAARAHVSSISEFLLTSPCLSFTVLEAGRKKCKKTSEGDNLGEYTTGSDNYDDDAREEEETTVCTFIRIYAVHTKALQELQIQYEPDIAVAPAGSISSISQDEGGFRDALTDISVDTTVSDVDVGVLLPSKDGGSGGVNVNKPLLMTPDAFSASPRRYGDLESIASSVSTNSSSFTQVTPVRDRDDVTSDSLSFRSPGNSTVVQSTDFTSPSQTPQKTQQLTPSSVPLPPVTPGEEETNSKHDSSNVNYGTPVFQPEPSAFSSPRPGVDRSGELRKDSKNLSKSSELEADTVKALFAASITQQRDSGSGGSSRSGSLEVDTILNRSSEQKHNNVSPPEPPSMPSPKGPYDSTIWPKAPDLNTEAKRLVTEALQKSGADKGDLVAEDAGSGDSNQDENNDDVQIVEVVEISEDDDDVKVIDGTDASRDIADGHAQYTQTPPTTAGSERLAATERSSIDAQTLKKLQAALAHLTSMLTSQDEELKQLRHDVRAQHQLLHHHQQHHQQLHQLSVQAAESRQAAARASPEQGYLERIDSQINDLQISLCRQVDSSLTRFSEEQKQTLQEQAVERTNSERQRHDRMAASIASQVSSATAGRIDKAVKQEMRTAVVPAMNKILEPVKDQLHTDVAQKLTATDQLVRDNISRLVNNRQTIDCIGQAVGSAVQGQVQAVYRETVQNVVGPSFDRCCQEMFKQINDAFMKGTKDYQSQMESQTERLRKKITSTTSSLQNTADALPKLTQDLQLNLAQTIKLELDLQLKAMTESLKDTLSQHVKHVVRHEIDLAMKQQQDTIQNSVIHAIRSSAATPLPQHASPDPQQIQNNILLLLQQGHINQAFQQALSASDLSVVMYVCESVDPQKVFSQDPCPLQQPVLLSLIQQLSADLSQNTELKHKYLQEAIMNLDTSNPVTRDHMPAVLTSLRTKLVDYIQTNPSSKMIKQMKMLLMASKSFQ